MGVSGSTVPGCSLGGVIAEWSVPRDVGLNPGRLIAEQA